MRDFRNLKVWEKSHQLTLAVYQVTATFSKEERYGLTSQMRRACVSISANIAEGCGRDGGPDFARFLQMSMGSASELEYHSLLARDLHLVTDEVYQNLNEQTTEVKRMLAALIAKVHGAGPKSKKPTLVS